MKIIVCMKQVPATSQVEIDQETGSMKRLGADARTNPYDLFALETALQIREKTGGTVTVLTMGPSQAEEMMRDAYTMGADPMCWPPLILWPRVFGCWEARI